MHAVLLCPDRQEPLSLISRRTPLVCAPLLGSTPLECWIEHFVVLGCRRITIVAADRPDAVRTLVGDGTRWGIEAKVEGVPTEPSVDEARQKYCPDGGEVARIDHLPGLPDYPLFDSPAQWYAATEAWLPMMQTPLRIERGEIIPGVRCGLHTHISPMALLRGPAWIGNHVYIGPRAVIGPGTYIEDRAWIDGDAIVAGSAVGPDTFVGGLCELNDSLAFGNVLVNWRDGAVTEVPDDYLLCDLSQPASPARPRAKWKLRTPWFDRAARPALATIPVVTQR